ncbi:response regulator [Streptomyces turgidiscabies]|uniref:Response regulator receiver domain protein n=1 Tax=Streptomyces turgidiscabies (strain Car8) TaxID=698760 RepID=L7EWS3_STRT8|nr:MULTISPECIES: response regulator transcription factor [Streptomyces]ELP63126.1 response regulator receiver domain protein [Streptomyces turgidiscabies Car8]MDX3496606.1 response regulator transcription factor [Streptomyces turgidiscabies]GAQ72803.1 response regulator protein VraR [Streptomyces turgidiscabies]
MTTTEPVAPSESETIRILIVDDHAVVREGLRALLEMFPDIDIVGEAADGRAALARLSELRVADIIPDVAIVDMHMPHMDGAATISRIVADHPEVSVLVLTSFDDDQLVRRALAAGCQGYLLKDAAPDELVAAVRGVYAGEMPIDPAVTRVLTRPPDADHRRIDALTRREREVLGLLTHGLSNREISSVLVISERTARTHVCNILAKLGFPSRTQAALWATESGLTPDQDKHRI